MKNTKRGGARKGAGRKPIKDKKIAITLWFRKSVVKKYGGKNVFAKFIYGSVNE